jgi:ribosomal protein S18 acetylase RimI-like enzyme
VDTRSGLRWRTGVLMDLPTSPAFEIVPLTPPRLDAVCRLARRIWQDTYPGIISQRQIDAMLADRYSPQLILAQLDDPRHVWLIARLEEEMTGFAHAYLEEGSCKLDKLYVDPRHQRRGIGRALFDAVRDFARQHQARRIWLQVNRHNTKAISAYRKYGFDIVEARVFDIGDGFVMDDYVMAIPT